MSYSAGVFSINSAGQPAITNTVISSTAFNALTSDLAAGLSTCILKDGTQTLTASIPFGGFKATGLGAGSAAGHSIRWEQSAVGVVTAKGDLVVATASGAITRQAVGSNGKSVIADSAQTNGIAYGYPAIRSYLAGCGIANGTDATNDLDVSAGMCADSTGVMMISVAAMAGKQLDANWASGANAGMRNSGAAITNTTYHIYAVAKADGTQDIYAHTSTTVATVITALQAESGGSAYLYARRIASIVRAGNTILAFTQSGNYFRLSLSVLDINVANPGTSAVTRTLASIPAGVNMFALFNADFISESGVADGATYLSDLSATDEAASSNVAPLASGGESGTFVGNIYGAYEVRTNTASAIRSRAIGSSTNTGLKIATLGWKDERGRDA